MKLHKQTQEPSYNLNLTELKYQPVILSDSKPVISFLPQRGDILGNRREEGLGVFWRCYATVKMINYEYSSNSMCKLIIFNSLR